MSKNQLQKKYVFVWLHNQTIFYSSLSTGILDVTIDKSFSITYTFQNIELEEQQLQSEVSTVSDKGRQLSHSIDLSDHDKAIRIYRQVEDLKVKITNLSKKYKYK